MAGGAWGSKPLVDPEEPDGQPPPARGAPSAPAPAPTGAFANAFSRGASTAPGPAPGGAYSGTYTDTGAASFNNGGNGGNLQDREKALKKKEAELAQKEAQLKKLESELKASGATLKKRNWPICYPLWHHDIAGEIPEKSRRVVREIYLCWWIMVVCMCWQVFCASVMMGYDNGSDSVSSWFLALIYCILGVPLGFILWYKRIYLAARDDGTMGYVAFFIFFAIHIGWCIWCSIAFPVSKERWSFTGFVSAMRAFKVATFPGIIYIVGASCWAAESVWCLWCLKDAYFFFRGAGGVQEAKKQAALAAFQSQMSTSAGAGSRV